MQPGSTITPETSEQNTVSTPAVPLQQAPQQQPLSTPPPQPQQVTVSAQAATLPDQQPRPTPLPKVDEGYVEPTSSVNDFEQSPYDQNYEQEHHDVTWTASEYIDHAKSPIWFAAVGFGVFVLAGIVYALVRDIFAAVLLSIAGITTAIFAGRKPHVVQYRINSDGIHIGQRVYNYADFRSFSVIDNGPLPSVLLTPLKRFLPPLTIFYDPNEEDTILYALADYLPHEDREPDVVDKVMSRIRF